MVGQACRTTFFAAADRRYELSLLPCVASALARSGDARVEIGLHEADELARRSAHVAAYGTFQRSAVWRALIPLLDELYRLLLGLLDLRLAWHYTGQPPWLPREVEGLLGNLDLRRGITDLQERNPQGDPGVVGDAAGD